MNRPRKIYCGLAAAIVVFLLIGSQRGWLASEPTCEGRTVTQWLDQLAERLDQLVLNDSSRELINPATAVTNNPAFLALLKIGPKAVPVCIERVMDPADWPPETGGWTRLKLWLEWRWNQVRRPASAKRPGPAIWPLAQMYRKTAAGFMLVAFGTNAHAGLLTYIEAYAAAPKHQSVVGTKVSGAPVGVTSSLVVQAAKSALPERRDEMIRDILKGLQHTNAWCRTVAIEVTREFPEGLAQWREHLLKLIEDEDEMVQVTALGALVGIVQQWDVSPIILLPLEIQRAVEGLLQNPRTSARVRRMAERVHSLAIKANAR